MKKIIYLAALCILLGSLFLFMSGCEQFGGLPSGVLQEKIENSKNYNLETSEFVNRRQNIVKEMGKGHSFWSQPMKRLNHNFFFNKNETRPLAPLPEDKGPYPTDFIKSDQTIKFIWLGHSTILVSINNKIILIDPVFSNSASPLDFFLERYQAPTLSLKEIPKIDIILISHDHYDHLDMETIKWFKDKNIKFVLPLGVSSHLKRWGIDEKKIIELDWWERSVMGDILFVCTPAQHFSGRMGPINDNKSLWASWAVKSGNQSFYFSGDSGYDIHYKNIGDKLGPFDIVFMDSAQYNERWRAVHNMPDEVIQGFQDLRGKHLVPVGWGMFTLSLHSWYDPIIESTSRAEKLNLSIFTPRLGQVVRLDQENNFEKWWKKIISSAAFSH